MTPFPRSRVRASVRAKLAALFSPPAWWLHGFYGVPPENSLLICRTVRHPAMVARWMAMRLARRNRPLAQFRGGRGNAGGIGSRAVERLSRSVALMYPVDEAA